MSAGTTRVDAWDGWRGMAILLVLIGHFTYSSWVWEERMGVDVFFVLSGMLMSNILFIDRMRLRDFYIRRISRVMPGLIVFLCAAYVVSVLLEYDFRLSEFLASLFFLRTYFPVDLEYFSTALPTGHLWSLNVEEHSYVIMSIMTIVLISRGKITTALMAIYLTSVLINFYYYASMSAPDYVFAQIRTESAIGFIAFSAAYNLIRKERGIVINKHMPLALFVTAFICYLDALPIWLTFVFGPVLLGLAVNHLTDAASSIRVLLSCAPLRWLGLMSYSIYLWQQIFYKLLYAVPGNAPVGFLLSIAIGAFFYFFIENPSRIYINNRWSPKPEYHIKPE